MKINVVLAHTIVDLMQGARNQTPGMARFRTSVSNACMRARIAKSSVIAPYSTRIAESPA